MENAGDDLQAVLDSVVDLFEQKLLLRHFCFQGALGAFQFPPFVEPAKVLQFGEQALAQIALSGLGVVQQPLRQLLICVQQLLRIAFERQVRMQHSPVVRGANEGQDPPPSDCRLGG
jgi:hypothetical protein